MVNTYLGMSAYLSYLRIICSGNLTWLKSGNHAYIKQAQYMRAQQGPNAQCMHYRHVHEMSSWSLITILIAFYYSLSAIPCRHFNSGPSTLFALGQWFPTFWVLSPGILFYKQFWSHVASKLSEIYHFVNFSGPAWTFFKSRYRDRSQWLGTSGLKHHIQIIILRSRVRIPLRTWDYDGEIVNKNKKSNLAFNYSTLWFTQVVCNDLINHTSQ